MFLVKVLPFSEKNFAVALSNKYTSPKIVESKNHFEYLYKYLSSPTINAQTILIEDEYVNKDYLHDYVSYYSLCFENYPKFCSRIHFFKKSFLREDLQSLILEAKSDSLLKEYIGFIVVKPIPLTVIGYTVLKPYDNSGNEKDMWGLRDYTVHLSGHELVLKSLAFQEQDSVLAACATAAIWTTLNKAASVFQTILKSPSQITSDADRIAMDGSRLFPNKGLNILQLCQAIHNSGLVSEVKKADLEIKNADGKESSYVVSCQYLKKILNAYSPIGLPIILIVGVPNEGDFGIHAITVAGYKKSPPTPIPPKNEISFLSDNIEKLYAHDDQFGPFAKIEFIDDHKLNTPWTESDPVHTPTIMSKIIVPIHPKVRISYEDIEIIVLGLDGIFTMFFTQKIKEDLVWDIKITFSEKFKKEILNYDLSKSEKLGLLTQSMPKYIWLASCFIGNIKILEFSFDATDVGNAMIGEEVICFVTNDVRIQIVEFLKKNRILLENLFDHKEGSSYYDFLITKISR